MKSKVGAAAAFAIIFVIILGVVSQFTPRRTHYICDAKEVAQWSLLGVVKVGEKCEGGLVSKSVGWPFKNKIKTEVSVDENVVALEPVNKEAGYVFQPGGFILNLIAYWIVGFVFFILFSPLRRNQKYIANPNGAQGPGKVYK